MTINKTDSGFDALLVHGIGLINDRVNYQFHDFYMSFNPVDRGGKYYINIFDKNYVLQDIIITDKVVLLNTMPTSHTMEKLFDRMEEYARAQANNVLEALVNITPSHSRVSPDNVGNTFKFVYVSGSPAIVCYDGSILRYCPFCGERIGEDQIPTNRFINADWREFK